MSNELLDEKNFRFYDMSLEEGLYYLDVIRNCKDICSSDHSVENENMCKIVEMRLKKLNDRIVMNGSLAIGSKTHTEYRCVEGELFTEKKRIIVDMLITRLCVDSNYKIYRVLDEFTLENNILKRRSSYNYDLKSSIEEVENVQMKGRLK